jgi:uncharacterized protein with PIN domain
MEYSLKFLVDDTLLGLLKKLRMIGYDSIERAGVSWWGTFSHAKQTDRIIVTLSKTVRHPPDVTVWVLDSDVPNQQVQEVLKRIPRDVSKPEPFSRCLVCNEIISKISADDAKQIVPPMVAQLQTTFYQCPHCRRIYWPGSHYHKMVAWMKRWEIYEKLGLTQPNP